MRETHLSFPDDPLHLPGFYPGNDRSDDDLLTPLVGVQVAGAAGIALGHPATHRQQILGGCRLRCLSATDWILAIPG
jgi:hypothetical protein